jgi:hypothetical protein
MERKNNSPLHSQRHVIIITPFPREVVLPFFYLMIAKRPSPEAGRPIVISSANRLTNPYGLNCKLYLADLSSIAETASSIMRSLQKESEKPLNSQDLRFTMSKCF